MSKKTLESVMAEVARVAEDREVNGPPPVQIRPIGEHICVTSAVSQLDPRFPFNNGQPRHP